MPQQCSYDWIPVIIMICYHCLRLISSWEVSCKPCAWCDVYEKGIALLTCFIIFILKSYWFSYNKIFSIPNNHIVTPKECVWDVATNCTNLYSFHSFAGMLYDKTGSYTATFVVMGCIMEFGSLFLWLVMFTPEYKHVQRMRNKKSIIIHFRRTVEQKCGISWGLISINYFNALGCFINDVINASHYSQVTSYRSKRGFSPLIYHQL